MTDVVRFEAEGAVGVITLDRPPLNAISDELLDGLQQAVDSAESPSVRTVVITGEPHFAAGADIRTFKAARDAGGNPASLGDRLSGVVLRLERLPKPVIAAVRGYALGGGLEIALGCDFRLMAESARCGQAEIALGIFPGAGGTQRLPRLIGTGPARELIYTGRQIDAAEALALGLADSVHPDDELMAAAMELAGRYADGPTVAIGLAKRAINDGLGLPLEDGLRLESGLFAEVFETEDAGEGLAAFLEKRSADFKGS